MNERRSFWQQLYRLKIHHVLLWCGYFLFWMIPYRDAYPKGTLFLATSIYFVFTAPAFYTTSYYLIPKYLLRRKYLLFFSGFIAMLIVLASLLALSLHAFFSTMEGAIDLPPFAYFWIAFISIVTMTGLLSGAKLVVDRIRSDRQNKVLEQQRLETELQFLKAQVNPHFLFNAINSVYVLIRKDPEKAAETLIKLSDLLRFQLYDTSGDMIPVEKEVEYLTNYIELEKLRRGTRVSVQMTGEGELKGFRLAPFLLMPLLENSFKHLSNRPGNTNVIDIALERKNGQLVASFYNTKDNDQGGDCVGGIGLKNLRRRLELLYPDAHSMEVVDDKDSYRVTLKVDVQ